MVKNNKTLWTRARYFDSKGVRIKNIVSNSEIWIGLVILPPYHPYIVEVGDEMNLSWQADQEVIEPNWLDWDYSFNGGPWKYFPWRGGSTGVMLAPKMPACSGYIKVRLRMLMSSPEGWALKDTQNAFIYGSDKDKEISGSYSGTVSTPKGTYNIEAEVSGSIFTATVYTTPTQVCNGTIHISACPGYGGEFEVSCVLPQGYVYECGKQRSTDISGSCKESGGGVNCTGYDYCYNTYVIDMW